MISNAAIVYSKKSGFNELFFKRGCHQITTMFSETVIIRQNALEVSISWCYIHLKCTMNRPDVETLARETV